MSAVAHAALVSRIHGLAPPAPKVVVLVPAVRYPQLAWCVSGAEGGHIVNLDTGNGFLGTFQWVLSTWTNTIAAMGVSGSYPPSPLEASYEQQAAAFAFVAHDENDGGAWPNTFGPCFAQYGWS